MTKSENCLNKLKSTYAACEDFRLRVFEKGKTVTVLSLETMCSDDKISVYISFPLSREEKITDESQLKNALAAADVVVVPNCENAKKLLLNGNSLVFLQGCENVFAVDTRTSQSRAISEPPTSVSVKGPREGFVEDIKTNVTLLRKRLKTDSFCVKYLSVGKYTDTSVAVCFLDGVADKSVFDKVLQLLNTVDIDGITSAAQLARFLEPKHSVLFHRVGLCEKPDVVTAKLLEGRLAILVDGTPIVITLPYLFIEDLQNANDYINGESVTTLNRVLRVVAVVVSVLLPAVYVSLQRYNYQIIPIKFLVTILNSTEALPWTPLSEMLFLLIVFDILREASLLMPQSAGTALSLVGAVVLGDAAVKAGLLGAPAVMIAALSGIGLYTMPDNTLLLSLLRLAVTFVGGNSGLFGVILCVLALFAYAVSLQSLGAPYLAPFAPEITHDREDAVALYPLFERTERPKSIKNVNETRQNEKRS